ncbi:hypothetical protein D3C81_858390 [compost metagenome]
MADGFDHLDRHQFVVFAGQVAVVLEQQRDAILQTQLFDALRGKRVLLFRQGRGGHAAAIMLRGIQRHAAPAGADLQQMVAGLQRELLTDPLQFVQLCLFEAVFRGQELRRRIHHGRVEKLLEQIVAKVVVRGDVLLRTLARVAVEPVQTLHQRPAETGQTALHGIEHVEVADEHADHGRQIRRTPVAVDKGLAGANRTVPGNHAPDGRIEHMDFPEQSTARGTEHQAFAVLDHQQLPVFQLSQLAQHATAQQRPGQTVGAEPTDRQTRGFHGGAPWEAQWLFENCRRQSDEQKSVRV